MCTGGVEVEKEAKVKPPFNDQNPVRHGDLREIIRLTVRETVSLFGADVQPINLESKAERIADKVIDRVYRK